MPQRRHQSGFASLGASSGTGLHVAIFILIYPVLTGFLQDEPASQRLAISIHLYDLLGAIGAATFLVVADRIRKSMKAKSSVAANLVIWAAASSLGVILQLLVASAAGKVPPIYFETWWVGFLVLFGQLASFQLISDAFVHLRAANRSLAKQLAALRLLRSNLEARIAEQNEAITKRMRDAILPLLRSIEESLRAGGNSGSLSEGILEAVDLEVRPLSRNLGQVDPAIPELGQTKTRLSAREFFTSQITAQRFFALPLPVVLAAIFVVTSNLYLAEQPMAGLAQSVVPALVLFSLMALVRRALRKRTFALWIALIASLVSASLGAGLLAASIGFVHDSVAIDYQVLLSFQMFIIVLGSHAHAITIDARWSAFDQRQAAKAELAKLVGRLKIATSLQARKLGYLIHGRVQAQLQAIALRLSEPGDKASAELEDLARSVRSLAADLNSDSNESIDLLAALEDLVELWDGICEIELELDESATGELSGDSTRSDAIRIVVEEAITNAVKHARAESIQVRLKRTTAGFELQVENDVFEQGATDSEDEPLAQNSRRASGGFGSQTYDAVTTSWSLELTPKGATLTAHF